MLSKMSQCGVTESIRMEQKIVTANQCVDNTELDRPIVLLGIRELSVSLLLKT